MTEQVTVSRAHAIKAIKASSTSAVFTGDSVTLFDPIGMPSTVPLPDPVPRKLIMWIANKFHIQPALFFHPEMLSMGNTTKH